MPETICNVFDAITSRRSVRAFLPQPVSRETIKNILEMASRAPSGSNIQPWRVWVLAGSPLKALTGKILAAHLNEADNHKEEYPYYPGEWVEPYLGRRRAIGKDMYALAGIAKGDTTAMKQQHGRNFVFFDAPVGLFITIDRRMNIGSWFDMGTFLQNILLAARGFGLHTCPQQSFSQFHRIIHEQIGIPDDQIIATAVALGYEDKEAPINKLVTQREPVSGFATFLWD